VTVELYVQSVGHTETSLTDSTAMHGTARAPAQRRQRRLHYSQLQLVRRRPTIYEPLRRSLSDGFISIH